MAGGFIMSKQELRNQRMRVHLNLVRVLERERIQKEKARVNKLIKQMMEIV